MIWYTLKYRYPNGQRQVLYNLQAGGCEVVQRAQEHLGSTNFERIEQPHAYSDLEINLLRLKG